MKKYQYQIVRYVHDRVTSEFVNVGIVLYQPDTKYLASKFISKYSRISKFFSGVRGTHIIATLKAFKARVKEIGETSNELFFNFDDISQITNAILPKDDSSLECSEIFWGIDLDMDRAVTDLFDRIIDKYIQEHDPEALHDSDVWKNVYKEYFDKYNLTKKLTPHLVKTENDTIEFDKAWRNGELHCYHPLSFDLTKEDAIKNKIYKWSGIINELEKSEEPIRLFLLTVGPRRFKSLNKLITTTFNNRASEKIEVSVVNQNRAEEFAQEVQKEMLEHGSFDE
jgi:hypothetical protein